MKVPIIREHPQALIAIVSVGSHNVPRVIARTIQISCDKKVHCRSERSDE